MKRLLKRISKFRLFKRVRRLEEQLEMQDRQYNNTQSRISKSDKDLNDKLVETKEEMIKNINSIEKRIMNFLEERGYGKINND